MKKRFASIIACLLLIIITGCSRKDSLHPDNLLTNNEQYKSSADAPIGLAASTATINGSISYQNIDGFGFSDGWSGTLSSAKNNALYGTLGLNILRAFKMQTGGYSTPAANITAAHAAGVQVMCSYWPGPDWLDAATGRYLDPAHYGDYANWISNNTTSIDLVSPFNEPNLKQMPADEIRKWVKDYGSIVGKPLLVAEASSFNDAYTDPVLNDASTVNKVSIIGGHFYGNGNFVHTNALSKGKHVWQTEHFIANSQTSITECMNFAKEVSDAMNNQFSAYLWWWVRDNVTDESNLVNNDGTIYKNGYILGQFAKYIRPGKIRIATTYNPASNVYVTAYRNNGIVIVAVNTGTSPVTQNFSISNITGLTSLKVNRTSANENMASLANQAVSNNAFTYTLPAQSVTTFHQF